MKLVISNKQTLPIDSTDTLHLEMVLTCTVVNPILAKSALDAFLACHLRKAYTLYMSATQSGKKYPEIDTSECVPSDLVTIEMMQVHCKTNKAVNGNKFQRSEAGCALEDTVTGEDINAFIAGLWSQCFAMIGVDVNEPDFDMSDYHVDPDTGHEETTTPAHKVLLMSSEAGRRALMTGGDLAKPKSKRLKSSLDYETPDDYSLPNGDFTGER